MTEICHYDVLGRHQIIIFNKVVTDAYPCLRGPTLKKNIFFLQLFAIQLFQTLITRKLTCSKYHLIHWECLINPIRKGIQTLGLQILPMLTLMQNTKLLLPGRRFFQQREYFVVNTVE